MYRIANLINSNNFTEDHLWNKAFDSRRQFLERFKGYTNYYCTYRASLTQGRDLEAMMETLGADLDTNIGDKSRYENMTNENAELAFRLLIYLWYCPNKYIQSPWGMYFTNLFENSSPKNIFMELHRLVKVTKENGDKRTMGIATKLLEKAEQFIDVKYKNLEKLKYDGKYRISVNLMILTQT